MLCHSKVIADTHIFQLRIIGEQVRENVERECRREGGGRGPGGEGGGARGRGGRARGRGGSGVGRGGGEGPGARGGGK